MIIKFARIDSAIDIDAEKVTVLEVGDRKLFARVVASLLSELGDQAVEPYHLFIGERAVSPKGKLLFLNDLPNLPIKERAFEKLLYERVAHDLFEAPGMEQDAERIEALGGLLEEELTRREFGLWGRYGFDVHWELMTYLKAFGFGVRCDDTDSFLERCIKFFGLCVDIGYNKPLVAVNLKSFLEEIDLRELYEQAFFHGISLVLLESWRDATVYSNERKICLELGLLED